MAHCESDAVVETVSNGLLVSFYKKKEEIDKVK